MKRCACKDLCGYCCQNMTYDCMDKLDESPNAAQKNSEVPEYKVTIDSFGLPESVAKLLSRELLFKTFEDAESFCYGFELGFAAAQEVEDYEIYDDEEIDDEPVGAGEDVLEDTDEADLYEHDERAEEYALQAAANEVDRDAQFEHLSRIVNLLENASPSTLRSVNINVSV